MALMNARQIRALMMPGLNLAFGVEFCREKWQRDFNEEFPPQWAVEADKWCTLLEVEVGE